MLLSAYQEGLESNAQDVPHAIRSVAEAAAALETEFNESQIAGWDGNHLVCDLIVPMGKTLHALAQCAEAFGFTLEEIARDEINHRGDPA